MFKKCGEILYKSICLLVLLSLGFVNLQPLLFSGPMAAYAPQPAYAQESGQLEEEPNGIVAAQTEVVPFVVGEPITSTVVADKRGTELVKLAATMPYTESNAAPTIIPNAETGFRFSSAQMASGELNVQTLLSPTEIVAQAAGTVAQNFQDNVGFENWYQTGNQYLPSGWVQNSNQCKNLGFNNNLQVTGWGGSGKAVRIGANCDDFLSNSFDLATTNNVLLNSVAGDVPLTLQFRTKRVLGSGRVEYYLRDLVGGQSPKFIGYTDGSLSGNWTQITLQLSVSRDYYQRSQGKLDVVTATRYYANNGAIVDVDDMYLYISFGVGTYQFEACTTKNCATHLPFYMTMRDGWTNNESCTSSTGYCQFIIYENNSIGGDWTWLNQADKNVYYDGVWGLNPTRRTGTGQITKITFLARPRNGTNSQGIVSQESPITVLTTTITSTVYLPLVTKPSGSTTNPGCKGSWCPTTQELINRLTDASNYKVNDSGLRMSAAAQQLQQSVGGDIDPQTVPGLNPYFFLFAGTELYNPPGNLVGVTTTGPFVKINGPPVLVSYFLAHIEAYLPTAFVIGDAFENNLWAMHGGTLYVKEGEVDLTVRYNAIEAEAIREYLKTTNPDLVTAPTAVEFVQANGEKIVLIIFFIITTRGAIMVADPGPGVPSMQPNMFFFGTNGAAWTNIKT